MTLGGLALAVGILVDDATVEIENIERNLAMKKELKQAILDGAQQIAVPAFVSTLCDLHRVRADVFPDRRRALSVRSTGRGGGLRHAGVVFAFANAGSDAGDVSAARPRSRFAQAPPTNLSGSFRRGLSNGSSGSAARIATLLGGIMEHRRLFCRHFLGFCVLSGGLVFFLGRDFFPSVDAGQLRLHVRGRAGLSIEETARLVDQVEQEIRREVPKKEITTILDNIGLPYSGIKLPTATPERLEPPMRRFW